MAAGVSDHVWDLEEILANSFLPKFVQEKNFKLRQAIPLDMALYDFYD